MIRHRRPDGAGHLVSGLSSGREDLEEAKGELASRKGFIARSAIRKCTRGFPFSGQ